MGSTFRQPENNTELFFGESEKHFLIIEGFKPREKLRLPLSKELYEKIIFAVDKSPEEMNRNSLFFHTKFLEKKIGKSDAWDFFDYFTARIAEKDLQDLKVKLEFEEKQRLERDLKQYQKDLDSGKVMIVKKGGI